MNLPQAIVTCLKKSFTFSGRASRSEYWWYILFLFILGIITELINEDLNLIFSLLLMPANISVTVRRLHDVNRSGWWSWISFTIIGMLFPLLYWYVQPSTDGDNDYGKQPE